MIKTFDKYLTRPLDAPLFMRSKQQLSRQSIGSSDRPASTARGVFPNRAQHYVHWRLYSVSIPSI
ncbi:MAG TPA: hypothetical protein H9825_00505 [Candidatus Sphingobacterium stercorigallinarum]|nr:hypothetical protein [Candidatus Sphingobacterium stercorigallinarum]